MTSRVRGVRLSDHLRSERDNLKASLEQVLLRSVFLAHETIVMLDAVMRTLARLWTRRRLLEWETAADAAARLKVERTTVIRRMWTAPALAIAFAIVVVAIEPSSFFWAGPVVLMWSLSPMLAYQTGLERPRRTTVLGPGQLRELRRAARLTWRFFEEVVGPGDNWLVPDNYQEDRPDVIAHRTSPTNIGLQMMATVSAWDLGFISTTECLVQLDRTIETRHKRQLLSRAFSTDDPQSLVRWRATYQQSPRQSVRLSDDDRAALPPDGDVLVRAHIATVAPRSTFERSARCLRAARPGPPPIPRICAADGYWTRRRHPRRRMPDRGDRCRSHCIAARFRRDGAPAGDRWPVVQPLVVARPIDIPSVAAAGVGSEVLPRIPRALGRYCGGASGSIDEFIASMELISLRRERHLSRSVKLLMAPGCYVLRRARPESRSLVPPSRCGRDRIMFQACR